MTINKNDNLDSQKNDQHKTLPERLLEFDKNFVIACILLFFAFNLIHDLVSIDISQEVQGFLVVIIGLLIIVGIDFFKKDTNTSSSNLKIPYTKIENNTYYTDYTGSTVYQNSGNTHYSSQQNIEEIAQEIKQIIEKASQNSSDSNTQEMQIIEAQLIEEIKHDRPDETKNLTDQQISTAAKTIEIIEQDKPFKQKVIEALKAGYSPALIESLNHPASSFVIAAIQAWNEDYNDVENSDTKHQNSDD